MRRNAFLIVMTASAIWFLSALWLMLNPEAMHALAQHSITFVLIAGVSVVSITFCYVLARRMPRFTLGLTVLTVSLSLIGLDSIALAIPGLDRGWIDIVGYAIRILLPIGIIILLWQGTRKGGERESEGKAHTTR